MTEEGTVGAEVEAQRIEEEGVVGIIEEGTVRAEAEAEAAPMRIEGGGEAEEATTGIEDATAEAEVRAEIEEGGEGAEVRATAGVAAREAGVRKQGRTTTTTTTTPERAQQDSLKRLLLQLKESSSSKLHSSFLSFPCHLSFFVGVGTRPSQQMKKRKRTQKVPAMKELLVVVLVFLLGFEAYGQTTVNHVHFVDRSPTLRQ